MIFDRRSVGQHLEKLRLGVAKSKVSEILWQGRRQRRWPARRLLESDRNWQESAESIPNALLPARGAADLRATASAADLFIRNKAAEDKHIRGSANSWPYVPADYWYL